ncbi:hypothetical protein MXB_3473 [Myxobolus squamalis]|nr:hypothetical protein MXB_3473 [Myxobolus squamalis]
MDFKPTVSEFYTDSTKNTNTSFTHIFSEPVIPVHNSFASNLFVNKPEFVNDNLKSDFPPPNTQKSPPAYKNIHNPDFFLDDILLNHGFTSSSSPTVKLNKPTLNEAKRMQEEFLNRDPIAKSIKLWTLGKGKNIRALLSTLQTIIWCPDKWNPVNLYDLSDYNSVLYFIRKIYTKACLLVHPDKV